VLIAVNLETPTNNSAKNVLAILPFTATMTTYFFPAF
jgi:hypothetical protein